MANREEVLDENGLIRRYRGRGILLDTNLLVVWLIGMVNIDRVGKAKRTENFTRNDFLQLRLLLKLFGTLIATPYILSQASDLAILDGKEFDQIRALLKNTVKLIDERYDKAQDLVQHPVFMRHGLADASVAAVSRQKALVMTADLELHNYLQWKGHPSLNFRHWPFWQRTSRRPEM